MLDWPTGKMNMEKTRIELEVIRKKASQENAVSSGTVQKPDYKEHAPPPKPSRVSKWFRVSLFASTLIFIGLLYYYTVTHTPVHLVHTRLVICVFVYFGLSLM